MMLKVLFCGYNRGIRSSRKLAAEFAVPRIDAVEQTSEETVEAVDADCDFFSSKAVHGLEVRGKDVCVGERFTKTAMNRGELEAFIREDEFIYDASRDVFERPHGNEHVFSRLADKGAGRVVRVYESRRRCDGCQRHELCFGRSKLKRHTIQKHVDFRWLSKHRERFLEPEYQERLDKWRLIERAFGHFKHNLGFREVPSERPFGSEDRDLSCGPPSTPVEVPRRNSMIFLQICRRFMGFAWR